MRSEFRGKDSGSVGSALKSAIECNLLIVDDFGAERIARDEAGDWTRQQIYTLMDDRMNWGRPIIVTTNLKIPEIEAKIGGDGHGGRIVSRLLKMAKWIEMDAPDARIMPPTTQGDNDEWAP
jgi:DNA replication protein DnaC